MVAKYVRISLYNTAHIFWKKDANVGRLRRRSRELGDGRVSWTTVAWVGRRSRESRDGRLMYRHHRRVAISRLRLDKFWIQSHHSIQLGAGHLLIYRKWGYGTVLTLLFEKDAKTYDLRFFCFFFITSYRLHKMEIRKKHEVQLVEANLLTY